MIDLIHWSLWDTTIILTRATRTPAFWEYPLSPMIPHTINSYQIPFISSQNYFVIQIHKSKKPRTYVKGYINYYTCIKFESSSNNKANLRDLTAATGIAISYWIQIVHFSARVTVKFDGWPGKPIGHFFNTTSSFVHHFKSISEFKLELQSGNNQFGSKLIFCPMWPWNSMDDLGKQ